MPTLYKFCAPSRSDYFKEFRLRFTPPGGFNDAYECFPAIDPASIDPWMDRLLDVSIRGVKNQPAAVAALTASNMSLRSEMKSDPSVLQEMFRRHLFTIQDSTFGVLCLTEKIDSQLMWAHYAVDHTGFAIGYDSSHSFFKNEPEKGVGIPSIQKVTYQLARPLVDLCQFQFRWQHVMVKHTDWAYENEWRMVKQLSHANVVKDIGLPLKLHLFDIPKDAVVSVIFGIRATPALKEVIKGHIAANAPHVIVKEARYSPSDFKVLV